MSTQAQDNFVTVLDERIRQISREVVEEEHVKWHGPASLPDDDSEGRKLRETLRLIMSEEFISVKEATLLLNRSPRRLHNLVSKAKQGKAADPVPFLG